MGKRGNIMLAVRANMHTECVDEYGRERSVLERWEKLYTKRTTRSRLNWKATAQSVLKFVFFFFFVFDSNHPLHPEDDNKRCKCLLGLSIFGATGVIPTWESGWLRRGGVGGRISSLFDDMVTPPPFPILSQFNHLEHLEFGVSQCPGLLASLYTQQA